MKLKAKFGTLFFALALAGGTLIGCNNGGDNPSAVTTKYYVNLPAASQDYTIAGINANGYEKGATVSFTVTLANPNDKELGAVKYDDNMLTAGTDGKFTFVMPEKDVRLSVTVKDIKKYALSIGDTGLKVDGTATVSLTFGGTPITEFTVEVVEGKDVASVEGKTLTGLKKGKFTIAASRNNSEVARQQFEITKNSKYTIKEAIDEAWAEVTNFNDNSKNTRTKDYYELTGKVVFIGSLYKGRYDIFLDDGSGDILCHQIVGTESTVIPFVVGDIVKTSTNLTNYFGLVEGYSSDVKYVTKVTENIPNIATLPFEDFDGAKFNTLAATYADDHVRQPIKPIKFTATAIEVTEGEGTEAETKQRYQIAGATALNNGRIATTASVIDMKWVEGASYEMKGYARDASSLHMNVVAIEQKAQKATAVSINGDASFELSLNNTKELSYTVTPAGAGETVVWTSSAPTVVSVDENGKIKALAAGEADITVKVDDVTSAAVHVTVPAALNPATAVVLDATLALSFPGEAKTLTPVVTPAEGCTDVAVWASSAPDVVTVENGVVTPLKVGEADVTVTYNATVSATCHVTVSELHGTKQSDPLNIDEAYAIANEEKEAYKNVEFYIEGILGKVAGYNSEFKNFNAFSYTSEGKEFEFFRIAAETEAEYNEYVKGGKILVKSKITKYNGTCETTQNPTIISFDKTGVNIIEISGDNAVDAGKTITLTAATYPDNEATVAWATSDATIATVENGVVTGVAEGKVNITATSGTCSKTYEVTVRKALNFASIAKYDVECAKAKNAITDSATIVETLKKISGEEVITGAAVQSGSVYAGANGGSGDTAWECGNILKIGASKAGAALKFTLAENVAIRKIVISGYVWKDAVTISISNEDGSVAVTSPVGPLPIASKANIGAAGETLTQNAGTVELVLDADITGSFIITSASSALCITGIELLAVTK